MSVLVLDSGINIFKVKNHPSEAGWFEFFKD